MRTAIVAAAVVLTAVGCKGTTAPVSASCTVMLTGALSGTYSCSAALLVWTAATNVTGLVITVPQAGSTPAVTISVTWPGAASTGTYQSTDAGAAGGINVLATGTGDWLASVGGNAPSGSYGAQLTSVSQIATTASGASYSTHGSLSATLTPVSNSGATGTLGLSATF